MHPRTADCRQNVRGSSGPSPKSVCESPNPTVWWYLEKGLCQVISVRCGHKDGWSPKMGSVPLPGETPGGHSEKAPSAGQNERLPQT